MPPIPFLQCTSTNVKENKKKHSDEVEEGRKKEKHLGVTAAGEKWHRTLLREALVLSCLLIKALICLAEGKGGWKE